MHWNVVTVYLRGILQALTDAVYLIATNRNSLQRMAVSGSVSISWFFAGCCRTPANHPKFQKHIWLFTQAAGSRGWMGIVELEGNYFSSKTPNEWAVSTRIQSSGLANEGIHNCLMNQTRCVQSREAIKPRSSVALWGQSSTQLWFICLFIYPQPSLPNKPNKLSYIVVSQQLLMIVKAVVLPFGLEAGLFRGESKGAGRACLSYH